MNIEQIRQYCLSKPGVKEGFPFSDTALVFKVAGKMFALLDLSEEKRGISLKCDPEQAIELRDIHPEVTAAYHFNKKHWNGIDLEGSISEKDLKEWIDHSYKIVVESLPKYKRDELKTWGKTIFLVIFIRLKRKRCLNRLSRPSLALNLQKFLNQV